MLRPLLVGLALLLAGVVSAAEPAYQFSLKKADDAISSAREGDVTRLTITGKSGIGQGKIELKAGEWTKTVVLRFEYEKGRGFQYLEGFSLRTPRLEVSGSERESKEMPFKFAAGEGKYGDVAGKLTIVVVKKKEAMELTLPEHLLRGAEWVELSWIDAYRN